MEQFTQKWKIQSSSAYTHVDGELGVQKNIYGASQQIGVAAHS